jgi:hypothetical protein
MRGEKGGGEVDQAFEHNNVVRFPLALQGTASPADAMGAAGLSRYEFTEAELAGLCRWFSAMKYAFPGTEGVMIVSHQESYSAVGLYNRAGGAPNCLVAKHEVGGKPKFFWSTEFDSPRPIEELAEITDAHIRAIRPPRNEKGWLDPMGWMGVYASRLITTQLQVV